MTIDDKLTSYARSCEMRAERSRGEAAKTRAIPATGWAEYDQKHEQQAKQHDENARRWDTRAAYAKKGQFAVFEDNQQLAEQKDFESLQWEATAAPHRRSVTLNPKTHKPVTDTTGEVA